MCCEGSIPRFPPVFEDPAPLYSPPHVPGHFCRAREAPCHPVHCSPSLPHSCCSPPPHHVSAAYPSLYAFDAPPVYLVPPNTAVHVNDPPAPLGPQIHVPPPPHFDPHFHFPSPPPFDPHLYFPPPSPFNAHMHPPSPIHFNPCAHPSSPMHFNPCAHPSSPMHFNPCAHPSSPMHFNPYAHPSSPKFVHAPRRRKRKKHVANGLVNPTRRVRFDVSSDSPPSDSAMSPPQPSSPRDAGGASSSSPVEGREDEGGAGGAASSLLNEGREDEGGAGGAVSSLPNEGHKEENGQEQDLVEKQNDDDDDGNGPLKRRKKKTHRKPGDADADESQDGQQPPQKRSEKRRKAGILKRSTQPMPLIIPPDVLPRVFMLRTPPPPFVYNVLHNVQKQLIEEFSRIR
eukprot:GEMP01060267.1.p1 GENE.GEMP01060267.1~~GEMP01060267.1.p1  ORF type:complete len:399 (+),score=110.81 GEMP01060267.1:204-1400(+)